MNDKLYWTDYCNDQIEVYDPITQHRRVLTATGSHPNAIIVDPGSGYVKYYIVHRSSISFHLLQTTGGFTGLTQEQELLSEFQWMAVAAWHCTQPI